MKLRWSIVQLFQWISPVCFISLVASAAALKSPFSLTWPCQSRSSAPGMQRAHIYSSPLSFCVTEFPWPRGDRWLACRLTAATAAAQSESPGLPASSFSLPRHPPQLQVQQQQQQQQQLWGDRLGLLGAQHGLHPAVEQRCSTSPLHAQPHPLQSWPLGQHDRGQRQQPSGQNAKCVPARAAPSTRPLHQQHLSLLSCFPLCCKTPSSSPSHLHPLQDRTVSHLWGEWHLQVRDQVPVCPRLWWAQRSQQAPKVQDGAMPHLPHDRLLPVRRPLPLHPQRRWGRRRQRSSETEDEASPAASQPQLCRLLLLSTDFPASWGAAAFFPPLHPGLLCLPFPTFHREPRAPLTSLPWAGAPEALPLPLLWHNRPDRRQQWFGSALLRGDRLCQHQVSHLQKPKPALPTPPAAARRPQSPSWPSALLLSWLPVWGRLHLLLLPQLVLQWHRVTKLWRPAPAHLQPPVCLRRVGKGFTTGLNLIRDRCSNC